jgi:hypothetical protein
MNEAWFSWQIESVRDSLKSSYTHGRRLKWSPVYKIAGSSKLPRETLRLKVEGWILNKRIDLLRIIRKRYVDPQR